MSSAVSCVVVGRVWQSAKLGLLECEGKPFQIHLFSMLGVNSTHIYVLLEMNYKILE